jgi:basic amino acid/polyamine antiporter, APA family
MSTSSPPPEMKKTLGLTGLTMNAMALIAPGAFLWLTYVMQAAYGAPMAGGAMWFGILVALLLCFATAISYAELSKLYPGAGSSYFFAEQAFLSKTNAYKFARLSKFIIGWASHLYYWVYPGVMVGVTAVLAGYLASIFWPDTFSAAVNSPTLMIGFCVVFSFGVAYIAYNGVTGTTGVNIAINVIQISALLVFSVIALGYRLNHNKEGCEGLYFASSGKAVPYQVYQDNVQDTGEDGKPKVGKDGKPVFVQDNWADEAKTPKVDDKGQPIWKTQDKMIAEEDLKSKELPLPASYKDFGLGVGDPFPDYEKDKDGKPVFGKDGKIQPMAFTLSYAGSDAISGEGTDKDPKTFNFHASAASVVSPQKWNFSIIQACIAILILVGFESVTSMGEEAKNAKRDIPRAVLLSLFIQGVVCYMIEYFAAGYFLNSGYKLPQAAGSTAPIGDMMVITGTWLFGSYEAARWYMLIQASTVFLALIGTTLSCMSTGARVTYAMGRDDEVPSHFGMLHGKKLTPHRAIWTLATVSAGIGILGVIWYLCGPSATDAMNTALTDAQKSSIWYPKFLVFTKEFASKLPNSLIVVTLVSNFGTFLLYMLTCIIAIVAFREHHSFHGFKHVVIPVFGLVANLGCMLFYIVGPFTVTGMSVMEPFVALGIAVAWGAYGAIYFVFASKKKGRTILVTKPVSPTPVGAT